MAIDTTSDIGRTFASGSTASIDAMAVRDGAASSVGADHERHRAPRAATAPEDLVASLRREIQAIDPKLIVAVIAPVMQDVERALVRERLLARLSGYFGALAVALAAIGVYGLMAYAVANRTREIGIRMALGAPRGHVLRSELWSALRLVAIGIAIGIPAAIAGGRMIAAQLFGVSASDPVTLAAAAGLMTLVAAFAAYGPAQTRFACGSHAGARQPMMAAMSGGVSATAWLCAKEQLHVSPRAGRPRD